MKTPRQATMSPLIHTCQNKTQCFVSADKVTDISHHSILYPVKINMFITHKSSELFSVGLVWNYLWNHLHRYGSSTAFCGYLPNWKRHALNKQMQYIYPHTRAFLHSYAHLSSSSSATGHYPPYCSRWCHASPHGVRAVNMMAAHTHYLFGSPKSAFGFNLEMGVAFDGS